MIEVPFTDSVALADLQKRLDERDAQISDLIDVLARELCLASNDPKPLRSMTEGEREEYLHMAFAAFQFFLHHKDIL